MENSARDFSEDASAGSVRLAEIRFLRKRQAHRASVRGLAATLHKRVASCGRDKAMIVDS